MREGVRVPMTREGASAGLASVGNQCIANCMRDANNNAAIGRTRRSTRGRELRPLASAPTATCESENTSTRLPIQ